MKKINTSNVTGSSRQPLLGRSISHLNEGIVESFVSVFKAMMLDGYTTNDVVIMHGCVNSGSTSGAGNPFNVTAGAVYYNDEIYQVDAITGVFSGTNVLVANLSTTYQIGDPVTMTDGSTKNVHEIKKVVISQAASGSGIKNHTDFKKPFSKFIARIKDHTNTYQIDGTNYPTWALMDPSFSITTPNDGKTRNLLIQFKAHAVAQNTSDPDGALGSIRVWNASTSTIMDFDEFRAETNAANNGNSCSINLMTYDSVAPNTTIQIWVQGYVACPYVRLSYCTLFICEQTLL